MFAGFRMLVEGNQMGRILPTKANRIIPTAEETNSNNSKEETNNSKEETNKSKEETNNSKEEKNNSKEEVNNNQEIVKK